MLFRQLFDRESCTYTYLLAGARGGEALLIDPVLRQVDRYLKLLEELDLRLVKAIDTHVHADHVTGLGALRDHTRCVTVMGAESAVDVVSLRVSDGDDVRCEGVSLEAMYTPGHTDDSYSFRMKDRVFTGDTLFIRGTGRTDFQHGDPRAQYHSLFERLLKLPDDTLVYPGHDYKGDTVSTIGEERAFNPRLQVGSIEEYVELMNGLNLPNPKLMDVAVPANVRIGLSQEDLRDRGWSISATAASPLLETALFVDLREASERERHGALPRAVHVPYGELEPSLASGGTLKRLAEGASGPIVFYCAFGERSAMATERAHELGLSDAVNLEGGIDAWKTAGGEIATPK